MRLPRLPLVLLVLAYVCVSGCASIDKSSVRATAGAPESARVDETEIPFNEELPRYALAVEVIRISGPVQEYYSEVTTNRESDAAGRSREQTDYTKTFDENYKRADKGSASGSLRLRTQQQDTSSNSSQSQQTQPPQASYSQPGVITASQGNTASNSHGQSPGVKDTRRAGTGKIAGQAKRNSQLERRENVRKTSERSGQRNDVASITTQRRTASRTSHVASNQRQIAAQFTSALTAVENFSVLDYSSLQAQGGGQYRASLQDDEVGPFIIQALITEYESQVEDDETKINVLLARNKNKVRKGVVALDVSILDGRTGRIVRSFPVRGTFTEQIKSAELGLGIYGRKSKAKSVLDQALRVALNKAAQKTYDALSTRYR